MILHRWAAALLVAVQTFVVTPVAAQEVAHPPRIVAVDYSQLDPAARAILDNCALGMWAYCFTEAGIPQASAAIAFSSTDADGAPIDCGPQVGTNWTKAHAAACAVVGRFVGLRPNWSSASQPATYVFDFASIAPATRHPRPATPAQIRSDGYPPISEENPCTRLDCRWSYPSRALRDAREGTVIAALVVDATGKGSDCKVLVSSWHEDLDSHACRNLTSWVRFDPAKGDDGEPATSAYTIRIPYVIGN